jgi:predicted amidophosphoribosyltransferase
MTSKDIQDFYKEHGICVSCGQEKAARGRIRCANCLAADAERHLQSYYGMTDKQRAAFNAAKLQAEQKRKELRRTAGICTRCGKFKANQGRTMCGICLAKHARYEQDRRIRAGRRTLEDRNVPGVCYFCGKPAIKGKKVCEDCYSRVFSQMINARAQRKRDQFREMINLFWKEHKYEHTQYQNVSDLPDKKEILDEKQEQT